MDDDKDDKSILEKFTDTVKSVAGAVVDAGKSPATLSHDVAVAPDAALMPMPLVPVAPAPKKKRKAPVKLSPAKIPPAPKNAAAKAPKSLQRSPPKKLNYQPDGRLSVRRRPLRRLQRKRRRRSRSAKCFKRASQFCMTFQQLFIATPGIRSSIDPGRSCPSDYASGRTGSDKWDLV
jgi:hypothetical protein